MEERYHATTQNRFYPDMSNVNKNITVVAKLISPPTYVYRRDSSWSAYSSTPEPDRSQHDSFHACVIAQQYSSSFSMHFNSCKLKFFKILFCFFKNWASLKLYSLHWIRKIRSRCFRGEGGGGLEISASFKALLTGRDSSGSQHITNWSYESYRSNQCEQNNVLVIACLCGWPSNCWHYDSSQFCLLTALASWMLNPSFIGEKTTSDRTARHFICMFESCLSLV